MTIPQFVVTFLDEQLLKLKEQLLVEFSQNTDNLRLAFEKELTKVCAENLKLRAEREEARELVKEVAYREYLTPAMLQLFLDAADKWREEK